MKMIYRVLAWLVALILLGVLISSYYLMKGQARYSVIPNQTQINIKHVSTAEEFLPVDLIRNHLPFNIKDSIQQAINTDEVEATLMEKIPFIKSVTAYVSPVDHQLVIDITGRKPILRFYDETGSYYLDEDGRCFPNQTGIAMYLPLVKVAHDSEEIRAEVLTPLANFLQEHGEWFSFFGMIEVLSPYKVHFHPRVGDYIFETIGVSNLEEDLDKVKLFYREIVPQVGANRYKLVKLSFDNQIVCKKR